MDARGVERHEAILAGGMHQLPHQDEGAERIEAPWGLERLGGQVEMDPRTLPDGRNIPATAPL